MELNFLSKLVCCHQYRSIRLRDPLLFIRTEGGGALEELGRGRRSFGGLSEEIWGDRRSFRWGWRSLGGGGSEKFWGVGGVLWGSNEFWEVGGVFFWGGAPKEFWEVEGVLGGSEEFWGGRRSFGGGHRSLGEWSVEFSRCWAGGVKGVWGGGQRSLGDTWFSGETEGGSVVANREKRGDCRKLIARE